MGTLVRTLRFRDLTPLIVGGVIGSGIFLVLGATQRRVDASAGLGLLAWLVGGLLSLLGALTYGELAAMNPETGGLYLYVRDGFGPLPAFLYGWTLFLVVSTGSVATLAVAFSADFRRRGFGRQSLRSQRKRRVLSGTGRQGMGSAGAGSACFPAVQPEAAR